MPDVSVDHYDVTHLENIDSELKVARYALHQVIAGMKAAKIEQVEISGEVDRPLEGISTFCKNARRTVRKLVRGRKLTTPTDQALPSEKSPNVGESAKRRKPNANGTH
jgi:hypothetical protein